jgi:hypothetical protein
MKMRIGRFEIAAFLRSLRFQLFSRQGPAYFKFLARTLLRRPRLFSHAVRLAIKGFHFQRFTLQTLAAHDFKEAALAGYERIEALAAESAASPEGAGEALSRHAGRARRSLRRRFRRLRPEFRRSLLPDRTRIEEAIQACVHEVPGLGLLRRCVPTFRRWVSDGSWRSALHFAGYASATGRGEDGSDRRLTVAPVVENGRVRRSLEHFFRELGVKVTTTAEQLAELGHERLERLRLAAEGDGPSPEPAADSGVDSVPDGFLGYLGELARRFNTLVLPLPADLAEPDDLGEAVQLLAARSSAPAAPLPEILCFRLEEDRGRLRERLVELGVTLVGDRGRAEEAFDRAFALG